MTVSFSRLSKKPPALTERIVMAMPFCRASIAIERETSNRKKKRHPERSVPRGFALPKIAPLAIFGRDTE